MSQKNKSKNKSKKKYNNKKKNKKKKAKSKEKLKKKIIKMEKIILIKQNYKNRMLRNLNKLNLNITKIIIRLRKN